MFPLAPHLLELCFIKAGPAFQVHACSREFLNVLIKTFPEQPQDLINPVHKKILALLYKWHQTIGQHARYRLFLAPLNHLYTLFRTKGFKFPEIPQSELSALMESMSFLSESELRRIDQEAQSARLEYLLQQNSKQCIEEANDLMKAMVGYDPDTMPDYAAEVRSQLADIEAAAIGLAQAISNSINNDTEDTPRVLTEPMQQDYIRCKASQKRLMAILNDAPADEEIDEQRIAQYLQVNDTINTALRAVDAYIIGEPLSPTALSLASGSSLLGPSAGLAAPADTNVSNLLDMSSPPGAGAPHAASTPSASSAVLGNLLDLDLTLPAPAAAPVVGASPVAFADPFSGFGTPSADSAEPSSVASTQSSSAYLLDAGLAAAPASGPGDSFSSLFANLSMSDSASSPAGPVDMGSVSASPVVSGAPAASTAIAPPPMPAGAVVLDASGIRIELSTIRSRALDASEAQKYEIPVNRALELVAKIHNTDPSGTAIKSFVLMLAVQKVMKLELLPSSSSQAGPAGSAPISQPFTILFHKPTDGQAGPTFRILYKISFNRVVPNNPAVAPVPVALSGELHNLPVHQFQ
ncbi:hypothetical protein H696_03530 [Fonticula alba]|uniref:VHS domain-containing protein n=1 Tax=Fonticula alba TaxID=691883 RepID=A0A058Z980_FONAL|nr:hypothetical protein H696_03530 [Fonticula alba]KCV70067.1 hypothetical protein H696_03530 [Fonticula alba]|eukprot:XP_009495673.1 hypothetical protein H696_03530 [Fonticula alba]